MVEKSFFLSQNVIKGYSEGTMSRFWPKEKKWIFCALERFLNFFRLVYFQFPYLKYGQKWPIWKNSKNVLEHKKFNFFLLAKNATKFPQNTPLLHSETKKMIFRPFLSSNSGLHLVVKIFICWHFLDFFLLFWLKFWSKMKISNFFFLHGLV